MYLIIGLGNPEEKYANTRHNMGFSVINKIAESYKIEIRKYICYDYIIRLPIGISR